MCMYCMCVCVFKSPKMKTLRDSGFAFEIHTRRCCICETTVSSYMVSSLWLYVLMLVFECHKLCHLKQVIRHNCLLSIPVTLKANLRIVVVVTMLYA